MYKVNCTAKKVSGPSPSLNNMRGRVHQPSSSSLNILRDNDNHFTLRDPCLRSNTITPILCWIIDLKVDLNQY